MPVTRTLSPTRAPERCTIRLCGTAPNAVIEIDIRPGVWSVSPPSKRTAVAPGILAQSGGKGGEPGVVDALRQRDGHDEAERLRAFGGKVGKIHAQRLAGDVRGRIVEEEVHAGNDAVGGEHEIASFRHAQDRGVVGEAEGAGMGGERPEMLRDQALLGRLIGSGHVPTRLRRRPRRAMRW